MYLLIILAVLFLAWVAFGYFAVRSVKEPDFKLLESKQGYEIREYNSYLVAYTEVDGLDYDDATNEGFRRIAAFIFGDNKKKMEIAMTTPVVQAESEPIAMTTPVLQNEDKGVYTVSFVMPAEYTLETLPVPNDQRVVISEVGARRIAVIRFSGIFSEEKAKMKTDLLKGYLERDGYKYFDEVDVARYNPPLTPPFMNRHEIWIELLADES